MHHIGQRIGVIDVYCVEEMEQPRKSVRRKSQRQVREERLQKTWRARLGYSSQKQRWQK